MRLLFALAFGSLLPWGVRAADMLEVYGGNTWLLELTNGDGGMTPSAGTAIVEPGTAVLFAGVVLLWATVRAMPRPETPWGAGSKRGGRPRRG